MGISRYLLSLRIQFIPQLYLKSNTGTKRYIYLKFLFQKVFTSSYFDDIIYKPTLKIPFWDFLSINKGYTAMTFIQNAKKLKKEKGLTTNELSKICGIPLGTLSKLFSGTIEEPKLSAAVAIAKSLGTTVDTLCDITDGTYTNEERDIIAKYRMLDPHAKKLVSLVISNEMARLDIQLQNMSNEHNAPETNNASNTTQEKSSTKDHTTTKTDDTVSVPVSDVAIRTLPLYSSTSSIGSIDNQSSIRVKNTGKVTEASYALRVNGDSMSPEYADGDILIIKEQDTVSSGELCIYICDGHGYFRKYSEDKLVSLNTQYPNVDIADFKEAKCVGLVLGRLRSKKN